MRFIPIVLFLSMGVLLGQPPQTASLASPPPPPPIISASVVGNQGQSTYNYWVVANYPGGSAVGQPASVIFAPNALTSTNSVRVSWAKLTGVTTFDVIRLTPPATFTGVCSACAVSTGLSGTVQEMNDIGGSVASYAQGAPAQGAAGQLYINTQAYTPPQIRQVVNGVDSAIGGSTGGATIPSTTNLIAGDGTGNGANSGIVPATVGLLAAVQSFTNKTLDGISPTIMGYLSNVTSDIQAQLNGKQTTITTGTTAQYFRGDLSLATFPTIPTVTGGTCTNQFVSAINTSAVPTCTTPVLNSGQFANQGTVTTLLHGNAAGSPSFGQVVNADIANGTIDLTSKVTGLLPHANIAATAVTPGSYTNGNFTVGADGSLTAASNGTAGTVTGVTATAPINSSGGTAPVISGTYEGNGSKIQLFTGADPATNDCPKYDVNHNLIGSGAGCMTTVAGTGVLAVNSGAGSAVSTSGLTPTVFNCDPLAPPFYTNLNACLDAAKTFVTTNETGSGKAASVLIPQGSFALTAPYVLNSGMQIYGIMPRMEYLAGSMPDLVMVLNGGTVINCGAAANCFTGTNLRGVVMQNLAFTNYTGLALSFGGNNIEGVAFSSFLDLYAIGSVTTNGTAGAWSFFNCQHIRADRLVAYNVNQGWNVTTQSSKGDYGNYTINDSYTFTYPKSAANGNNTIPGAVFQVLAPSSGSAGRLNNVTLNRWQVNSYNGDATGSNMLVAGLDSTHTVIGLKMFSADIEGNNLYGLQVSQTLYSYFDWATTVSNTYDMQLQAGTLNSVFTCSSLCQVAPGPGSFIADTFYGNITFHGLNSLQTFGSYFDGVNTIIGQGKWTDGFGNAGPPITTNAVINSSQTVFTMTGCSATSPVGGGSGGRFASGTTGTCTVVITMKQDFGAGITAPNGWACWGNDLTTTADTIKQTVSTATTATLSGTTVSGDLINFGCMAY